MDISNALTIVGGLTYISFTIYRANHEAATDAHGSLLRWLLYGVAFLVFLYGLLILQLASTPLPADAQVPQIDPSAAAINFLLTTLLSLISAQIVASARTRVLIRRFLPANASYDPNSSLHTTAWVLMLALIAITISDFVFGGGIQGLAQNIAAGGVSFGDILFEDVLWVFAAALGIGLFLRRTPEQARIRLGLRLPTREDVNAGIGIGLLLFALVIVFSLVWSQVVSPQEIQQESAASDQLAQVLNSVPLALLTSIVVAIGEEVFFRGALQPVFGNVITSVFFALLHTQYTLTPAALLIFITSLALGWLRERYSTSASIIGHFVYNFVQLALAALGTSL